VSKVTVRGLYYCDPDGEEPVRGHVDSGDIRPIRVRAPGCSRCRVSGVGLLCSGVSQRRPACPAARPRSGNSRTPRITVRYVVGLSRGTHPELEPVIDAAPHSSTDHMRNAESGALALPAIGQRAASPMRQFGRSRSRRRFVLPESGDVRCRPQRGRWRKPPRGSEGERAKMPR
jgi:hypothetical protein